jgi:predicted dehydrogenase
MSPNIPRRDFLKRIGAAGAGLGIAAAAPSAAAKPELRAGAAIAGRPLGANDRVRAAVIGVNSRGAALAECFAGLPGVEVAAVCDVDERAVGKGVAAVRRYARTDPRGLRDFRRILDDPAIDAVAIATPDHWHAPMSILALAAGKHVFVEKPCSHNGREGELLIEAVHKSQRVFQMGAQRRSFPNMKQAIAEIRAGRIGKTTFAKGWYANNRGSIGRGQPAPVPSWLDYELWQGPAPRRPFRDNLIHYNWHWFWHWGTGETLNNGTHEIDVCRWALGVDWPRRVVASGGRYHFQDDWETPDTQVITWDYDAGKTITWESRSCNDHPVEGLSRGVMVCGTEGSALLDGDSYTLYDTSGKVIREVKSTAAAADRTNPISATGLLLDQLHVKNFVDAVRTGGETTCGVEDAHKSTGTLHLGNIAWRTGRALDIDPATGRVRNDPAAMALWGRSYEPGWEPVV